MSEAIFRNLSRDCPREVADAQELINVEYIGMDGALHRGQVVADRHLGDDLRQVFAFMQKIKFPLARVTPASHLDFFRNGSWDDNLLMAANNTSAFNYRVIALTGELSNHARGWAIDVNPFLNPYVHDDIVEPAGAVYDPSAPGTLTADHPVTLLFKNLGWAWGGDWKSVKDYQHFEKPFR